MFFEDSIKTPITDDYVIIQELGRTLHSVVKKARNKKNGELVAIKFLDKNKIGEYEIVKEVAIMKELEGHPGVIRLKDVYETPNEVILVLEYASGGELFDKIQELNQYSEKDAQVLFQQIASIVQFLHSKDIVHRDLKPENLLFVDEKATTLKLADFGTAEIVGKNTLLYATVGSPGYMAPEVLNGSGYSKPADIFSLGVILYILLGGLPPFLPEEVGKGVPLEFPSPEFDNVSEDAKKLIVAMLNEDPKQRPTIDEIVNHPWVKGEKVQKLELGSTLRTLRRLVTSRRLLKESNRHLPSAAQIFSSGQHAVPPMLPPAAAPSQPQPQPPPPPLPHSQSQSQSQLQSQPQLAAHSLSHTPSQPQAHSQSQSQVSPHPSSASQSQPSTTSRSALVKEESVKGKGDAKATTKTTHHEKRKSSSSNETPSGHQRKVSDKKESARAPPSNVTSPEIMNIDISKVTSATSPLPTIVSSSFINVIAESDKLDTTAGSQAKGTLLAPDAKTTAGGASPQPASPRGVTASVDSNARREALLSPRVAIHFDANAVYASPRKSFAPNTPSSPRKAPKFQASIRDIRAFMQQMKEKEELEAEKRNFKRIKEQMKKLKSDYEEEKLRTEELQTKLFLLQKQFEQKTKELEEQNQIVSQLQKTNRLLMVTVTDAETLRAEFETKRKELENKIQTLERELEDVRQQNKSLEIEVNVIKPELEKKTKQLVEATKTIRKLEQELKLERELRQNRPAAENKTNPSVVTDTSANQKFVEEKQRLENEIKQLKSELQHANEEIQILQWKVEELSVK